MSSRSLVQRSRPLTASRWPIEALDADLTKLALQGRRDAWDALIGRHQRRVLLTLLARGVRVDRATRNRADTWIRLLEKQAAGTLTRLELPGLAITQAIFLSLDDTRREHGRLADTHDPRDAGEPQNVSDQSPNADDCGRQSPRFDARIGGARALFAQSPRSVRTRLRPPQLPHAEAAKCTGLSVQRVRQSS